MTIDSVRVLALAGLVLAAVIAAAAYRTRVGMPRPPVGLFVWSDVWVMIVVLVGMPFAYVHLPAGLVVGLFGLVALLIVQMTLAPLVGGGPALVAAAAICVGQVVAAAAGARTVLIVAQVLLWHRLRAGAGHPPEDPIVTAALDNLTG